MTNVKIKVTGADISVTVTGGLTVGMTGATYEVVYDQSWNHLAKLVVFRAGVNQLVAVDGLIPAALLREERALVEVGVEGRDQEGKLIVPTIWANVGFVLPSANADGATNIDPDNPVWAQSAAIAQEALEKAKSLEQRADNGEFQGALGPQGPGYEHSEEFSRLANQVHADTEIASNAAKLSGQNASHAGKAAQEAQAQAVRAKQEADRISSIVGATAANAAELPAEVPEGLPQDTARTTQGVLNALALAIKGEIARPEPVIYSVTYRLNNMTSNNDSATVESGKEYNARLAAAPGFRIGAPIITMGEIDITSSCWHAPDIHIDRVTGNISIVCEAQKDVGPIDTSPRIVEVNKSLDKNGGIYEGTVNGCYTDFYPMLSGAAVIYFDNSSGTSFGPNGKLQVWNSSSQVVSWSIYQGGHFGAEFTFSDTGKGGTRFRASLSYPDREKCYAYDEASGTIYFAGKETKYYGMTNISSEPAANTMGKAAIADQTYAMEDLKTGEVSSEYPGVSAEWVQMVKDNYAAFAAEAFDDYDKIPFIVHTDQHAQFRKNDPAYKLMGDLADWFEISKCINLGDTCGNCYDEGQLAAYQASMDGNIPYSKRIECYGNHDVWVSGTDGWIYTHPQGRIAKYLKTIYAHRHGSNGYFSVKDPYYNVKYIGLSDYEYAGNLRLCRMSTQQSEFLASELSAEDGYDIIICSHQPLDTNKHMVSRDPDYKGFDEKFLYGPSNESFLAMIKARHDFAAGVFVDGDGVEHPYDFTGLKSKLLCSFHGHDHFEAYYQLPDSITEIVFDYFKPDRTFYWGYVDRKAMKLKLWKNQIGVGTLEINLT